MPASGKGTNDNFYQVRQFAKKQRTKFAFTTEELSLTSNYYVAWLDLMGAGHLMNTSVHKTANFLVRLHMAVGDALTKTGFAGKTLAINDGIFFISPKKDEIMLVIREAMTLLALFFVAVSRPQDRFFVRGGIAYGPVYFGSDLIKGISNIKIKEHVQTLDHVAFGPPIIDAYRGENKAPPFGIAISESARAFAPEGIAPFRMTHWLWWQNQKEIPKPAKGASLSDLKKCLLVELLGQFKWMRDTLMFNEITLEKVSDLEAKSKQYFLLS